MPIGVVAITLPDVWALTTHVDDGEEVAFRPVLITSEQQQIWRLRRLFAGLRLRRATGCHDRQAGCDNADAGRVARC
jgi:hypothetical protein